MSRVITIPQCRTKYFSKTFLLKKLSGSYAHHFSFAKKTNGPKVQTELFVVYFGLGLHWTSPSRKVEENKNNRSA